MSYLFLCSLRRIRLRPGACGSPFLGDSFWARSTSSSSSVFGTASTRRMTALKCENSGVDSNAAGFITSYASLAVLAALLSVARTPSAVGVLGFPRQLIVCNSAPNDLFHDGGKAFTVRQLAVIVPKNLFVNIAEQVKRLDADVRSVQAALKQRPEILQPVGMNLPIDIRFSMVDDTVHVALFHSEVSGMRIP